MSRPKIPEDSGAIERRNFKALLNQLMTGQGLDLPYIGRQSNAVLASLVALSSDSIRKYRNERYDDMPSEGAIARLQVHLMYLRPSEGETRAEAKLKQELAARLLLHWEAAGGGARKRTERSAAPAPAAPAPSGAVFFGRTHELLRMDEALRNGGAVAILGLPGIGKTTLARHCANRHAVSKWRVHECNANSADSVIASLAGLAVDEGWAHANSAQEPAASRCLDQMALSQERWLLVYDNVRDPGSLMWPRGSVRVIATSRLSDWKGKEMESIELRELAEQDAVQFLQDQSGRSDPHGARKVFEVIGGVCLALEHAAAFCSSKDHKSPSFDSYAVQAAKLIRSTAASSSDSDSRVAATFRLAIAEARRSCPAAAEVMTLLAYCDAYQVPQRLLAGSMRDPEMLTDALDSLRRLSLIGSRGIDQGSEMISVHRLVQLLWRAETKNTGQERQALTRLASHLIKVFPKKGYEDHRTWDECKLFAPHALHLWDLKENEVDAVDTCELVDSVAMYLLGRSEGGSDLQKAEALLKRVVKIRSREESWRPAPLALALSDLALVLHYKGDLSQSMRHCERALALRRANKDPKLAWSVNNKAALLKDLDRLPEALTLMREALTLTIEADPPETLDEWATAYDNVGEILLEMNEPGPALEDFRKGLDYRIKYYGGLDHSDVAYSQYHIASALLALGDLPEAERLCMLAIDTNERKLGAEHLDGAVAYELLARIARKKDDERAAAAALRKCLAVYDSALCPDNPQAIDACRELAALESESGNETEAAELLRRVVTILLRDPSTTPTRLVEARLDLAFGLQRAGSLGEASRLASSIQGELGPRTSKKVVARLEKLLAAIQSTPPNPTVSRRRR